MIDSTENKLNRNIRQPVGLNENFLNSASPDMFINKDINSHYYSGQRNKQINIILGNLTSDITFTNCSFLDVFIQNGFVATNYKLKFVDCDFDNLIIAGTAECFGGIEIVKHLENDSYLKKLSVSNSNNVNLIQNYTIEYLEILCGLGLTDGFTFNNCNIKRVSAELDKAVYTKADSFFFYNCTFNNISGFNNINFLQQIEFVDPVFSDISDATHSTFRHLKHNFQDLSNDFLTNLFASLELKSKFKTANPKKDRFEHFLNIVYQWLNDFGLDPYRPFMRMLKFSISSSIIIFFAIIALNGNAIEQDLFSLFHNFIVIFSGPFGHLIKDFDLIIRDNDRSMKSWEIAIPLFKFGFFTVMSLQWFFLILGVRRRFKIN